MNTISLPIDAVLNELEEALRQGPNAVLVAPPGAGKTTRIPLALLDEPWLQGKKIRMLEPRRLAAKSAARYMARALGEEAGGTVGYRVRMDTRVGPRTRVEVMTEGVLTRLLQADPALEDTGIVIFDEFHERSLQADLGLALSMQAQGLLRPDLRILVMSATLGAEPVAELLGGAPVIRSEGRMFPVDTRYRSPRDSERLEDAVERTVREALENEHGDVLVFLPGVGVIRRVEERLADRRLAADRVRVVPLHGSLTPEAQDRAIAPSPAGKRKVVLATTIAETGLTVEGIRVVVDSGLMRSPRFSPRTGMTRLETGPVSQASAEQRRGRAGRVAPGVCYRLWPEERHRQLPAYGTPEIVEADLAPLALELAAWGAIDPGELAWIDPPPAAAYAQACGLLRQLGALGPGGAITPHGRRMAELGVHPRLAHMMLCALPLGWAGLACELAALLGDRDLFKGPRASADADIRLRVEALRVGGGADADPAAVRRLRAEAAEWRAALGVPPVEPPGGPDRCGVLLAFAYPDRIGQSRGGGKYLLSGGRGAMLAGPQPLSAADYLVACELDDQGADSRIYLAAPIAADELERHLAGRITEEETLEWDTGAESLRARKRVRLDALVLKETPSAKPDPERLSAAMLTTIARLGLELLPWTKSSRQLLERMRFMNRWSADWPDVADASLVAGLQEWLGPHIYGMRSRSDLQRISLKEALEGLLTWTQKTELDREAPTHIIVPSGSKIPVDYGDPEAPSLAVRLQEVFGWTETPRLAGGRVPLTLHLLSPAQRPVQVTRDLASFWRQGYFDVKKDLKGRYPKHYWPEDPTEAVPTHRVRPPRP